MSDHEQLVRCLRRIEVAYGADGWHGDEYVRPWLCALSRRPDGRLSAVDLRIPDTIWHKGPPGHILDQMARKIHKIPELVEMFRVEDWHGLAYISEAWTASTDRGDGPGYERLKADGDARRIHLRPDRRNGRFATAITRDLDTAFVFRHEGEDAEVVDEEVVVHGEVRHALSALVATLDVLVEEA